MKFVANDISNELKTAFTDFEKPMAKAAARAMLEVAHTAVEDGRDQIAAKGFSDTYFKWQSGFQYQVFPGQGKPSLRPAARVEHKVGIASVFEHSTTIGPEKRSLMWLPLLGNLPAGWGRGGPNSGPKNFRGKLSSVNRPGKRPLLVGKGAGGKNVPLFVGIDKATMPKKFSLYKIIQKAADRLPEFYFKNFKAEG